MIAVAGERMSGNNSNEALGLLLFARYAYPPNVLGYCGPPDHQALLEYGAARVSDPGLAQLARSFEGPWPYLTLIAGAAGIDDPFDARVVEAYWLGNRLLAHIDRASFGDVLMDRFRRISGPSWRYLAEAIPAGGLPHHAFHVFGVYPWVGLLVSGRTDHPLHVLDRCRIRWGRVVTVEGDLVVVRSRPLTWDGRQLALGPPQFETVHGAVDGMGFVGELREGDWVSLHWDWICDRLNPRQLANLRGYTLQQLDLTNHKVAHPGPAMALA
ncbi:MAG: DUF6390 family protein [Nitriliruptorales bacterium]